ncbi:MAG: EAL domain-containing protein [Nitrosospira sp.]
MAGLAAGGITALSVDKISVFSFLSLILMPLIVRFGMEGSEISLSMSIMTTLFLIVISQNALRVGHTLRENIRLRIEASTREEALQESKVRLQQLNQNLEQLVTERTSELRENEARFRFLFEQAAVGVAQIDIATGRFVRVNQKYADVVGYTREEMLALNFHSFAHPADLEAGHVNLNRLKAEETHEFELENRYFRKDGRVIWVKITVSPMRVFGKRPEYHIVVIQDITESKEAEEQIHQLAFYDPLTKLPNRRLFLDRLQRAQIRSTRRKTSCAVFFIDLDNFKALNDTQGHDIGDLLLIEVAERLKGSVRSGDTVARLGGDEFVVTVEGLSEDALQAATEANDIGEKILEAINEPFRLRDFEYHGSSSIGIRSFNDSKISMDDLLKHADAAMYKAKTAGRNTLCFFDPSMQAALEMRTSMAVELRQAIARQQFKLYYQRQVNAEGVVVGAEALLRWQHPQRGMVSPMVFIPIAEETGLIVPIGKWVLQVACIQLKQWAEDPVTCRLQLAVNISARQFLQQDFVNQVLEVLAKTGADPFKLKLELTESLVLHDIAHSIEKMQVLCTAGIRFSLDDFGTGHSSLTYLKRLPLEQIKIDKSFINDIATNVSDEVIVRTIIAMSNSLGMEVIAEGVETEDQREFLARNGCYMYQGYLFGKPIPIEDFGV